MSSKNILKLMKDKQVEFVDLRFVEFGVSERFFDWLQNEKQFKNFKKSLRKYEFLTF